MIIIMERNATKVQKLRVIDLLKDKNLSEEKRIEYLDVVDRKSQRLQELIEDLFEMSKASSGNITLNYEQVDIVSLMKQTLFELDDKVKELYDIWLNNEDDFEKTNEVKKELESLDIPKDFSMSSIDFVLEVCY